MTVAVMSKLVKLDHGEEESHYLWKVVFCVIGLITLLLLVFLIPEHERELIGLESWQTTLLVIGLIALIIGIAIAAAALWYSGTEGKQSDSCWYAGCV